MTAPATLQRFLDQLRNAECAGLGFAALADEGDIGHRAAFKVMRESLEKIQRARREYEQAMQQQERDLLAQAGQA